MYKCRQSASCCFGRSDGRALWVASPARLGVGSGSMRGLWVSMSSRPIGYSFHSESCYAPHAMCRYPYLAPRPHPRRPPHDALPAGVVSGRPQRRQGGLQLCNGHSAEVCAPSHFARAFGVGFGSIRASKGRCKMWGIVPQESGWPAVPLVWACVG